MSSVPNIPELAPRGPMELAPSGSGRNGACESVINGELAPATAQQMGSLTNELGGLAKFLKTHLLFTIFLVIVLTALAVRKEFK